MPPSFFIASSIRYPSISSNYKFEQQSKVGRKAEENPI